MEKEQYVKLLNDRPWDKIDDFFGDKDKETVEQINHINIDSSDWIQFSIDNFDLAQQKYEVPKTHYSSKTNWLCEINNTLGRNEHNSYELNYGMNGNTNSQLIELIGKDNIEKLGIEHSSILVRLIVNMPGNGVAWHYDDAASYLQKFPEVNGLDDCMRLWFPVIDWENGHAFQIGNSVLTHWNSGNVWCIPWGVPHASSNFGYKIKYTVSLTARKQSI